MVESPQRDKMRILLAGVNGVDLEGQLLSLSTLLEEEAQSRFCVTLLIFCVYFG